MWIAEDVSPAGGVWGLLGVVAMGVMGWGTLWIRSRLSSPRQSGRHSEEAAAAAGSVASQEMLEWIEEHTVQPLYLEIARLRDELERKERLLREANSSKERMRLETQAEISNLKAQLRDAEDRLRRAEAQVDFYMNQIGGRRDGN